MLLYFKKNIVSYIKKQMPAIAYNLIFYIHDGWWCVNINS